MSIKASVTHVYVGPHSIEGLMNVHGEFGVGVPQFADTFSFLTKNASRDIKALLDGINCFVKWSTPLNSKPINVIPICYIERLIFILAQQGNSKAIRMWNDANPGKKFEHPKEKSPASKTEAMVETRICDLYQEWNPQRQVVTDFGIADIVHEHGVIEIKEFKSISSAHNALGQAMSYGAILNKQPEVVLFNVPDNEVERVVRLFTSVCILVLIYTKEGTKLLLERNRILPNYSNINEISFWINKKKIVD